MNHVKTFWEKLTWSRAFLPPGAPQSNNAVESFNRDFKRDELHGLRPAVFDCATGLIEKVSTLSKEGKEKKFHDTDDNRDYTNTELDEITQCKRQLQLWGNFVFPFWENDANDDYDIPDAVGVADGDPGRAAYIADESRTDDRKQNWTNKRRRLAQHVS